MRVQRTQGGQGRPYTDGSAMKLRVTEVVTGEFTCVDDDTYDGAPDSEGVSAIVGLGKTEEEALENWTEQYVSELLVS